MTTVKNQLAPSSTDLLITYTRPDFNGGEWNVNSFGNVFSIYISKN